MKFIISGKNIEVTEGIKAAIEEKLGRLDKYLVDDTIVNVTLSVQKGRQKIEVTIPMKGHIIRAEEGSGAQIQAAADNDLFPAFVAKKNKNGVSPVILCFVMLFSIACVN